MYSTLESIPENDVTGESASYLLVTVSNPSGNSKTVVVGMSFDQTEITEFKRKLPLGYSCTILGGGKIFPSKRTWGTLELGNTDAVYGAGDHELAAEIIRQHTPFHVQVVD